jgi:hypothetical protein
LPSAALGKGLNPVVDGRGWKSSAFYFMVRCNCKSTIVLIQIDLNSYNIYIIMSCDVDSNSI